MSTFQPTVTTNGHNMRMGATLDDSVPAMPLLQVQAIFPHAQNALLLTRQPRTYPFACPCAHRTDFSSGMVDIQLSAALMGEV